MKKYIVFDFDGVILDSFKTAYDIMWGLNAKFNLFELSKDKFRALFDENVWEAYEREGLKGEIKKLFTSEFKVKYLERKNELKFFEGIRESILEIAKKHSLVIISSNHSEVVKELLNKEALLESFSEIIGAEIEGNKREKLTNLMKRNNLFPSEVYFVSDTNGDIHEVTDLGIHAISVSWGFHDKERLKKSNSEITLDTPGELRLYFETITS